MSARTFIAEVVDPGSFDPWDEPVDLPTDPSYADAALAARDRAATDEAVVTGSARIGGRAIALLVGEFGFLGGSIGRATADRAVAALCRATDERLPVLAAPASGGTRMQEGTPAFVGMLDLTAAVVELKAAGLPYLVHLRHPTTGGVLASWGSLGHITTAEPGALIGFLGPSVFQALNGQPFPRGIQQAENLARCGIVDRVSTASELRREVAQLLGHLAPDRTSLRSTPVDDRPHPGHEPRPADVDVWTSIELSGHPGRPGARELLAAAGAIVPLSGTGAGERGDRILACVADLAGTSCVVVAQDRKAQRELGPLGPADLRAARRFVRLADDLGLPLVMVVDTPGADLSVAAEEGALAGEIARLLAELAAVRVPTVALLLGEGCGGAALAMASARRVIAAEHAWLAPLPLAGASTILHGTPDRAAELAKDQRIRSLDLLADGIADVVVPEPVPAHLDPAAFCLRMAEAAVAELDAQRRPARV